MTVRALLVGLGTIGRTHAAVLRGRSDVELVGGVDPAPPGAGSSWFDGTRWSDLDAALADVPDPDLVVLATPTHTHVDLVDRVLASTDARVLCEKPLADSAAALDRLEAAYAADTLARRVAVAHHFAFSPEVEWASALARRHPEWGPPTSILSVFNDAYAALPAARLDSVVSSWVDSGPNQLSVAAAFLDAGAGWQVASHAARRDRAVTTLEHGHGTTTLTSNWLAADSSKQTTVRYGPPPGRAAEGADQVELRLDHTSMTALLLHDDRVAEHVAYTGSASRKDAHYLGLYAALLGPADPLDGSRPDPRLGLPLARRIARTLESAHALNDGRSPGRDPVAFSDLASGVPSSASEQALDVGQALEP